MRKKVVALLIAVCLVSLSVAYGVQRFIVEIPATVTIQENPDAYNMTVTPSSLDFGTILCYESVERVFTVKNDGNFDFYLYVTCDMPEDLTFDCYQSNPDYPANGWLLKAGAIEPFSINVTAGQVTGSFNLVFVFTAEDELLP